MRARHSAGAGEEQGDRSAGSHRHDEGVDLRRRVESHGGRPRSPV